MNISEFWKTFPDLKTSLKKVKQIIESINDVPDSNLQAAIQKQLFSGKMVRPALCLIFGKSVSAKHQKEIFDMAAAIEIMHYATLIHDDIIDNSDTRRNSPSIPFAFGNDTAVYAGDYLFVQAFKLFSSLSEKEMQTVGINCFNEILYGELKQNNNKFNTSMTMQQYLEQIKGKTAALFALTCYCGSYYLGKEKRNAALEIGYHLGITFQLLDDYLDLTANQKQLGKPANQDLKLGIYSAPTILTLNNPNYSDELKTLLKENNFEAAQKLILDSGAMLELKEILEQRKNELDNLIADFDDPYVQKEFTKLSNLLLKRKY